MFFFNSWEGRNYSYGNTGVASWCICEQVRVGAMNNANMCEEYTVMLCLVWFGGASVAAIVK